MRKSSIKTDVLVVGAGMAGVLAALAASRSGVSVLCVNATFTPGGQATQAFVSEMSGYSFLRETLYGGIEAELVEQMIAVGSAKHYFNLPLTSGGSLRTDRVRYNPEILKIVLDWLISKSTVTAIGGAGLLRVAEEASRVQVTLKTSSELIEVTASIVIDATGTAEVVDYAGMPTESAQLSNESATLLFRLSNTNHESLESHETLATLGEIANRGYEEGILPARDFSIAPVPGTLDAIVDATRVYAESASSADVTRGVIESRTQILRIIPYLKENVRGLELAALAGISQELGFRSTRRIRARARLTEADITHGRKFSDAVAFGCSPMGYHNAVRDVVEWSDAGGIYQIPYSAMIPVESRRILAAGRCIGCDERALTTIRCIPVVMNVGEVAGYAAAMAVRHNTTTAGLDPSDLREYLTAHDLSIRP